MTFLQSCYYYKIRPNLAAYDLKNDSHKLNGNYANVQKHKCNDSIVLWQALTKKSKTSFVNQQSADNDKNVVFTVLNKKQVKIELVEKNTIVDTKILKGKFIDSAFYVKKRRYFMGLPPLFVWSHGYKIMITKTKNDDLVLDLKQHRFGWILILTGGFTQPYTLYYTKEN